MAMHLPDVHTLHLYAGAECRKGGGGASTGHQHCRAQLCTAPAPAGVTYGDCEAAGQWFRLLASY